MNTGFKQDKIARVAVLFMCVCLVFTKINAQNTSEETSKEHVCTEDKNMIIGKTTLDSIEQNHGFWSEYLLHYADYQTDKTIIEQISQQISDRNIFIVAVIGTWCGDSKEQFPVFEKIMEQLSLNEAVSIEIIGVDRDKLAGDLDISHLNIAFVPTFIFYENNQELGRIVETPSDVMEKDILNILNNK
jgi:thiol-disulfide isomerase/thioredoxin